jgi:glycosyltransferase involved in cell wall biosynthesis
MDLSLVIPLFNEEESLPELERWIRRVVEKEGYTYEILFIDDGSKDKSWEVVEQLATQNPYVRGIKFRRNYGKSAALHVGFEAANGDVVITMDADLQDNPDEIPELVRMIREEGYDLVSGWKKKRKDPISKTIPSKFYNFVVRKVSGITLHDFNCGLKAYKNKVIKSIEVYGDMHRFIPLLAKWSGFRNIGEKVVEHRARKYGYSKFGMGRLITGFLDLLSVVFVGKFKKSPMQFLGTLGTVFFFMGFVILAYLSYNKLVNQVYQIQDRPIFYLGILTLIIGTQLFMTGFLAELISRNSSSRNNYLIDEEIGNQ